MRKESLSTLLNPDISNIKLERLVQKLMGGDIKKYIIIFLTLLMPVKNLHANHSDDNHGGFYVGVDAAKNDNKIGKIDNSIAGNTVEEDRYYGYKFSGGGFFLSPEIFTEKPLISTSSKNNKSSTNNKKTNPTTNSAINANYGLKANIGYDFNNHFSGFLTYDVAKFSYNAGQGSVTTNQNDKLDNSTIGIGSQINLSDSFGVKILYKQQQVGSSSVAGGKITSDVIKFGTIYNF